MNTHCEKWCDKCPDEYSCKLNLKAKGIYQKLYCSIGAIRQSVIRALLIEEERKQALEDVIKN